MKTPRFRATAAARRAHGLGNRPMALAFVIGTAAWVAAGWAAASVYHSVALIWSVAGEECADVPLTLDGDDVWSGAAVVPQPASPGGVPVTIQFQFMVDGSLQPAHYGWGGPGPLDLAFGANPPNVVLALDGGPFGLGIFRRLLSGAPAFLKKGGALVFEIGERQEKLIERLLAGNGAYGDVSFFEYEGKVRVVSATKK